MHPRIEKDPDCYSMTASINVSPVGQGFWQVQPTLIVPPIESARPRNILFLLDISPSMDTESKSTGGTKSRLNHAKAAMEKLLDELQEDDQVAMVSFNEQAEICLPFQKATKVVCQQAIQTVSQMSPSGTGTSFPKAFQEAKECIGGQANITIIFLTDGEDNTTASALYDLVEGTRIIPIGIFSKKDSASKHQQFLDELYSLSGGVKTAPHIYENETVNYQAAFEEALQQAILTPYQARRMPRAVMTIATKDVLGIEPLRQIVELPLQQHESKTDNAAKTYSAYIIFPSRTPPTHISWSVYIENQWQEIVSEEESIIPAEKYQALKELPLKSNLVLMTKKTEFLCSLASSSDLSREEKGTSNPGLIVFPASPESFASKINHFRENMARSADALATLAMPCSLEKQFATSALLGAGGAAIALHSVTVAGISPALVLGACATATGALLLPLLWYGCWWLLKQNKKKGENQAFILSSLGAAAGAGGGLYLSGIAGISTPFLFGFCATGGALALPLLMYAGWRLEVFIAKQSAETLWKAAKITGLTGLVIGCGIGGYFGGVAAGISTPLFLGFCATGGALAIPVLFGLVYLRSKLKEKLPPPPPAKIWGLCTAIATVGAGTGYFSGMMAGVSASLFLGACATGGAVVLPLLAYGIAYYLKKPLPSKKSLLAHSLFATGGIALGYYGGTHVTALAATSFMTTAGISAPLLIGACATGGAAMLPLLAYGLYRCCAKSLPASSLRK
jgi:hypothetical protein